MSSPPGTVIGEHPLSITLSTSLSSRGTMSQSASGRHLRRVTTGNRSMVPPAMNSSSSFSKSPRLSLGARPVTPVMDRSPTSNDARKRTSTEPVTTNSSIRTSPSNLTVARPSSSYLESPSSNDAHLVGPDRTQSYRRSRPNALEPAFQERPNSPATFGPPDSFRPAKHVFDQSAIRPRPWKGGNVFGDSRSAVDTSYCSTNSVPPEQTDAYESTEQSVKDAIKSVTMFSIDVVVKILDSGILAYVPIPGLEGVAQVLVSMWTIIRAVSNNRLRLLRLTQRCAHILLSIRQEVQDAGDRIHSCLQRALEALHGAFTKVRVLAETQIEMPFLKRLLGRKEMEGQFSTCDEDLNNALKLFSLSVQISTMKLVLETTENLRRQNEDLASQNQQLLLLCSPRPPSHPSPGLVEQTLSACSATPPQSPPKYGSIDDRLAMSMSLSDSAHNVGTEIRRSRSTNAYRPVVHRATASSRSKQVSVRTLSPEPRPGSLLPLPSRALRSSSRNRATSKDRFGAIGSPDLTDDPMAKIVHHQRIQNEFDQHCDMEDFKQLIKETLDEGKDSFIIKLLQIDVKDFPQAIVVLQHELHEYQSSIGKGAVEERDIHQDFIQRGVDAMKRMTQNDEMECPEWAINKFKILELETIGYGSFSTVRRGLWNEQVVAIKILSPKTKRTVFENEMRIWKGLSHPNILPLFGASNSTEEPLFFVSLYAKHGNLVDFLQALRRHDLEGVFGSMLKDHNSSPTNDGKRKHHSRRNSNSVMREQALYNRWYGSGSPSNADFDKLFTLPLSKSDSKFNRCHVLKDGDIFRFMLDIARGMEYLHENGVLHGDLKASNALVNDSLSCVISDFGQSERRTDIYRASGWTPKGTARWKAPELLNGAEGDLSTAVDVYAFAITCIEIMSMGSVPWGSMEDSILCHRIVVENLRPPIPPDFRDSRLDALFDCWWNRAPNLRPEFKQIVTSVQMLCNDVEEGALEDIRRKSQRLSLSPQPLHSPEFPPVTENIAMSFDTQSPTTSPTSPSLSSSYQETGKSYYPVWVSSNFSDLHLSPSSLEYDQLSTPSAMPTPMMPSLSQQKGFRGWEAIESPRYTQAPQFESTHATSNILMSHQPVNSASSATVRAPDALVSHVSDDDSEPSFVRVDLEASDARFPASAVSLELKHEELYRRVEHDFHWTLRIPLWNPAAVKVGDVGYIHQDTRTFVTLFNAFKPFRAGSDSTISIPSIFGFGDPIPKHSKIPTQKSRKLFRTFTYKLEVEEGQPMAHCFCESPDWHYLEETKPPQAWFKASVDSIIKIHGEKHGIAREDLFLVVGALQASRYSLFISCNHPSGSVEFTANSAKKGRPWGSFSVDILQRSTPGYVDHITASRISEVSGPPKALFLSALRFPFSESVPILV